MSALRLTISVIGLLIADVPAEPALDCGWRETEPAQFSNRRGPVEWGSDADRSESSPDRYGFARFVVNRDTAPAMVQWDVAGVLVPRLPGEHALTVCVSLPMKPYMIYGPISLNGGGRPVHTTVWEAGFDDRNLDQVSSRELEATIALVTLTAQASRPVALRVVTKLVRAGATREFTASYRVENVGTSDVEVTWPVMPPLSSAVPFRRLLVSQSSASSGFGWETASGRPLFLHVLLTLSVPGTREVLASVTVPTFAVHESVSSER